MSGKWAIPAIITSIILLSGTFGFVLSNSASAAPDPKVTICHFPPGNQPNVQTITVGFTSVPFHVVLHGDYVGDCTDDSTELMCKLGCVDPQRQFEQCIVGTDECTQKWIECAADCED